MNLVKSANFIPISRKIFEHEFWEESRCFSKFEAWMDLLQLARFENSTKNIIVNNKTVSYCRGQLVGSIRFLQKRWNWGSISKVENFLKTLKTKDMIDLEKGQGVNIITICKYGSYNIINSTKKTAKGQGTGQQKDNTNKENNINKEIKNKKDITVAALSASQTVEVYGFFKTDFLRIYLDSYGTEYIFSAKDGSKVYSVIKKVVLKMKEKTNHEDFTVIQISDACKVFLLGTIATADNWLNGNFNLSNIDSKFNDIFTKIKANKNGNYTTKPKSIFSDY